MSCSMLTRKKEEKMKFKRKVSLIQITKLAFGRSGPVRIRKQNVFIAKEFATDLHTDIFFSNRGCKQSLGDAPNQPLSIKKHNG